LSHHEHDVTRRNVTITGRYSSASRPITGESLRETRGDPSRDHYELQQLHHTTTPRRGCRDVRFQRDTG
jgi:hypothetical protein